MKTLTDTQLARIAFWTLDDPGSNAEHPRQCRSNIKASFYGHEMPHPDALPTQDEAREMLREFVGNCRKFSSRYNGDCSLTDSRFSTGTQIYYLKSECTYTLLANEVDEFLAVAE